MLDEQLVVVNDIADDLRLRGTRLGDPTCDPRAQRRSATPRCSSESAGGPRRHCGRARETAERATGPAHLLRAAHTRAQPSELSQ